MKKFLALFALLLSVTSGQAQNNVIAPNASDLIQIISPFNRNASLFYTTPTLLSSVIPTSLTVGTTPITGACAGGILYDTSSTVQCSTNATLNAGGDFSSAAAFSSAMNLAGSAAIFGRLGGMASPIVALGDWGNGQSGVFIKQSSAVNFGAGNALTSQTIDVALARNAAGVLEVDTGAAGVFATLKVGAFTATLPSATGTNAVCNTPGTSTALSVQVWATGCAASSARFKDAITAIDREKAFETILALQPVSYFYKPEFNMGSGRHVGFTAEQVGSVDPSLITFEADGVTPHAVKYNEMAPLFAAAIQQLKADNDNLRSEIEDLKRRVR